MKRAAKLLVLLVGVVCASVAHAQTTPKAAEFRSGSLAFGSITGSYVQVLASGVQFRLLTIINTTNQDVQCSWDDGTTFVRVRSSGSFNADLRIASLFVGATALKCKHAGVAPSSGALEAFGMY
jgi:hypothetical protein